MATPRPRRPPARAIPALLTLLLLSAAAPDRAAPAEAAPQEAVVSAPSPTEKMFADRSERIARYFEPSYITAGAGYNRSRPMNWNDLFYEAQIAAHFTWNDSSQRVDPEQDKDMVRVMLPVRIQVRQYTTESSPVKTPSYNPGIRMYYTRGSWGDSDGFYYLSAGYHHYSNGQSGPHYNPNGTINTDNGSFSLEYAELSLYRAGKADWLKLNYRQYLVGRFTSWEPAQSHYYERELVEVTWRREFPHYRGTPAVQFTAGLKIDRDFVAPGTKASFGDNLQLTGEAMLPVDIFARKKHWQDIQFYVRYDRGYDYYNIHYQEKINRVQFGLVARNF